MGQLQDYIDDPNVTDIYVNGCRHAHLKRRDGMAAADPIADSDEELIDMIQTLARRQPRRRRR